MLSDLVANRCGHHDADYPAVLGPVKPLRFAPSAVAVEAIRGLIETILLEPDGDQLKITLQSDLAGMPETARGRQIPATS